MPDTQARYDSRAECISLSKAQKTLAAKSENRSQDAAASGRDGAVSNFPSVAPPSFHELPTSRLPLRMAKLPLLGHCGHPGQRLDVVEEGAGARGM
jgi:hypothetical protein